MIQVLYDILHIREQKQFVILTFLKACFKCLIKLKIHTTPEQYSAEPWQ